MAIAFITHQDCQAHEMGKHHPEQPARLHAISDRLIAGGLDYILHHHDAPLASREQLESVHDPEYVAKIYAKAPAEGLAWVDRDTAMNPYSLQAARRAAGAAILAVDLVMQGKARQAFCAVRPPGHHAEKNKAMGFCLFNNIAIGAYHALQQHGLERIAIVDFDVHHGNGTENIVSGDERILFCSSFRHPFYPDSGYADTAENICNIPLPASTKSLDFREKISDIWLPRLAEFSPQLIMISAGFDAHVADDMGGMALMDGDFNWITRQLLTQANASAHGRIVSTLEGGYELHSLARSVETHLRAFLGESA